jgi:hypothetical protein
LFQIPGIKDALQILPGISRDPKDGSTQFPTATNYAFEQALPFLSSVGRAGQAYTDPDSASNASGAARFIGVPMATRTPEQQLRDRQQAVRHARKLAAAKAGEARLESAPLDGTSERAARLLARYQAALALSR